MTEGKRTRYMSLGPCTCGARRVAGWYVRVHTGSPERWDSPRRLPGCDVYTNVMGSVVLACACGREHRAAPVRGRMNPKVKCGARCLSATGHDCTCECGGKNHGGGYSAAEVA